PRFHARQHEPFREPDVVTIEDFFQLCRVISPSGADEVAFFAKTLETPLPLPPFLDVDAVTVGESPPPLRSPWPNRRWSAAGDNVILASTFLDGLDRSCSRSEKPSGLVMNDIGIGKQSPDRQTPLAQSAPEICTGFREIDTSNVRKATVDGAEDLAFPEL